MYLQEIISALFSIVNHHLMVHYSANVQIYIYKTQRSVINILFNSV